jgi:GH15 family glucan-1,4-alpha-glucosidase
MDPHTTYPRLADYGFIGDCHTCALVSRDGSIDWCAFPRTDSPSVFGRLLDWQRGGFLSIRPEAAATFERRYLPGTMVLETTIRTATGRARLLDFFAMREGGRHDPHRQLLRIVEGLEGEVAFELHVEPRFDYGAIAPWLRLRSPHVCHALGGDTGLVLHSDAHLTLVGRHTLHAAFRVRAGERCRTSLQFFRPELLYPEGPSVPGSELYDQRLEETVRWWRAWAAQNAYHGPDEEAVLRSALILKALTNAPTGAIAAAATTSLPEEIGGERNWDYRFSWIRDSVFTVRTLNDIGFTREAEGFRAFIQRSAAGSAEELQVLYGLGGERRLSEWTLDLEGYLGSRPVRVGNAAAEQVQLDAYGSLVWLSWSWFERGHVPDDDYWRFLVELCDTAARRWREPDRGIWEIRGEPLHFVHSKAMCWVALDRGLALARALGHTGPVAHWQREAEAVRAAILEEGVDHERGVFVQAFGRKSLDASLLLLPTIGFVDCNDPLMVRTTEAIRQELMVDGFVLRYRSEEGVDGLSGREGAFLACTFWLVECLAKQGRLELAEEIFARAAATANDLGLFSEEWDPHQGLMLGNLPQGLSHLSYIAAALALHEARS